MSPSKKRKKSVWIYILIALLTFVVSLFLSLTEFVRKTELSLRDNMFEIRGPLSVEDSPIVLVAISDEADEEIPQKWPWPTSVHAKLVENLTRAGAKAILFDVLFTNPDEFDPKNDTFFAEAIRKSGKVVLAGDIRIDTRLQGTEVEPTFPIKVLRENNPNPIGIVKMPKDTDGEVRWYYLGFSHQDKNYYMLALEAIRLYEGLETGDFEGTDSGFSKENPGFNIGPYDIQRFNGNAFYINYYGPEGLFPTISFDQVIDDATYTTVMEAEAFEMNTFEDPDLGTGLLYDEVFKDKIVIVGSTMPVLQDFHTTPFASGEFPRPGFEIHAHAIQTILDGNYITSQSGNWRLILMLGFSFLVVFINRKFSAVWGFIFMLVLIGGYYYAAIQFFLLEQVFIHITGVHLSLFLGQVGTVGYEYVNEQREKRRIKGMFSSYVSPTLVEQMIESGEEPRLGGDETYMTAFFSDIVSFSTFSEKLEPKQLVTLINEYLTAMTDIINDQHGTLDKFIGDAIVAFFGAPLRVEDHALRACISSQLMQKKLAELREKWSKENWPDVVTNMHHRMGMNTGEMVTGNMGSERRFNYTMMGDNVNLAARCESGAKQYNVYTMVTESTKLEAEKFGDDCLFRLLDNIVVKGRTRPVKVYEIAGLRADASQEIFDCIGLYEQGMEKYFSQDWDGAIKLFEQSVGIEAHLQNPSELFIRRCQLMKKDPPTEDWDGVFVMTSK